MLGVGGWWLGRLVAGRGSLCSPHGWARRLWTQACIGHPEVKYCFISIGCLRGGMCVVGGAWVLGVGCWGSGVGG